MIKLLAVLSLLLVVVCANRQETIDRAKQFLDNHKMQPNRKRTENQLSATQRIMQQVMAGVNAAQEGSPMRTKRQAAYDALEASAAQNPAGFEAKAQKMISRDFNGLNNNDGAAKFNIFKTNDGAERVKDKFLELTANRKK